MAKWTQERYNEMKKLFDDNKITKKDRAQFEVASHLRWLRHQEKIIATDEQIVDAVNQKVDWVATFEKGVNWTAEDEKFYNKK